MNICPVCEKETLRKAADFVECIDKACGFYADGDDMTDALQFEYKQAVRSQLSKLTELEKDNASLRARVGEQQTQAKIDVLNELLQEIDETVYVETWGYIEQKRDELSAALAKGAK